MDRQSTVHGLSSFDQDKVEAAAQALDLCLACKGCKSECPSGVDMARAQIRLPGAILQDSSQAAAGLCLWLLPSCCRAGCRHCPDLQCHDGHSADQKTVCQVLGITDRRPFPKFTTRRSRLQRDIRRNGKKSSSSPTPSPATSSRRQSRQPWRSLPAVAMMCRSFRSLGQGHPCIRRDLSKPPGKHAGRVLDALNKMDPAGEAPIVGIEPPEVYFLKNEYPDLLPERKPEIQQRLKTDLAARRVPAALE